MIISVLYGADDFSLHEALHTIKDEVELELGDANTTVFEGSKTSFGEVEAACNTVPFLADKRLVVVEGLLLHLEGRSGDSAKSQWDELKEYPSRMPPTTHLVLVDGPLKKENRLLKLLGAVATVREFRPTGGGALRRWVRERVTHKGGSIDQNAVNLLADLVGSNLWAIDSEIEKLCLYREGEVIQEEDVRALASSAREVNIFAAVDAVLEGRAGVATRLMQQLLQSGDGVSHIMAMLARQVRLLILSKDFAVQRFPPAEAQARLGVGNDFAFNKIQEQSAKFSAQRLVEMHRKLLETDLNIKRGNLQDTVALELLVAQLNTTPGGRTQRPLSSQPRV